MAFGKVEGGDWYYTEGCEGPWKRNRRVSFWSTVCSLYMLGQATPLQSPYLMLKQRMQVKFNMANKRSSRC